MPPTILKNYYWKKLHLRLGHEGRSHVSSWSKMQQQQRSEQMNFTEWLRPCLSHSIIPWHNSTMRQIWRAQTKDQVLFWILLWPLLVRARHYRHIISLFPTPTAGVAYRHTWDQRRSNSPGWRGRDPAQTLPMQVQTALHHSRLLSWCHLLSANHHEAFLMTILLLGERPHEITMTLAVVVKHDDHILDQTTTKDFNLKHLQSRDRQN